MNVMMRRRILLFLITLRPLYASPYEYCSNLEYNRCVKIADPLIREAHLIFPDNIEDIDSVCRIWNKFVDCLKRFTDECFSDEQRHKFNIAVSNPIESVHKMCMDRTYQQEYLQYAPCIKRTITDMQYCGKQYSLLVDQVAQEDLTLISKATICCSQDRFRKCVQRQTELFCDSGVDQGPALQFSTQIIDKALTFLLDQCYNYTPNTSDCIVLSSTKSPDRKNSLSNLPRPLYRGSTYSGNNALKHEAGELNLPSSTPWIPSGNLITSDTTPILDSTQILGSRTRPASYGRSNSWLETITQSNLNPHIVESEVPAYPTPTDDFLDRLTTWRTRPEWITTQMSSITNRRASFGVLSNGNYENDNPVRSTETWYPAAGNQISNEVDEPNQQGLSYKNNHTHHKKGFLPTIFVMTIIAFFMYNIY